MGGVNTAFVKIVSEAKKLLHQFILEVFKVGAERIQTGSISIEISRTKSQAVFELPTHSLTIEGLTS